MQILINNKNNNQTKLIINRINKEIKKKAKMLKTRLFNTFSLNNIL